MTVEDCGLCSSGSG